MLSQLVLHDETPARRDFEATGPNRSAGPASPPNEMGLPLLISIRGRVRITLACTPAHPSARTAAEPVNRVSATRQQVTARGLTDPRAIARDGHLYVGEPIVNRIEQADLERTVAGRLPGRPLQPDGPAAVQRQQRRRATIESFCLRCAGPRFAVAGIDTVQLAPSGLTANSLPAKAARD